MEMNQEPLTGAEARRLSGFLRGKRTPDNCLSFNALKGLAYSICCSPELIMPSDWLPVVFGGSMPEFADESDMEYLMLIMRLYNQVALDVLEVRAGLPSGASLSARVADNFIAGAPLHEWSKGFVTGLDMTRHHWQAVGFTGELQEMLTEYWHLLGLFANEKQARAVASQYEAKSFFKEFIKSVRSQMPGLIKEYAALSRTVIEEGYQADVAQNDYPDYERSGVTGSLFPDRNNLEDELLERAFEGGSRKEQLDYAEKVLALNPDRMEAYLIKSMWEKSTKGRLHWLEQAVLAGERTLGSAYFEEHEGYFWGLHETRPYMSTLGDLALTYAEVGNVKKAIELEEKLLRLNPNDNQGVRFSLITHYLEDQRYEDAALLLKAYEEDKSAFMQFNQVLLCYVRNGNCADVRQLRDKANAYNKHVCRYLSGKSKMPADMPEYYGRGDKNEAIMFVAGNLKLWRSVIGLIPWLCAK